MLVICWAEPKYLYLHGGLKSRKKPAGLFGLSHLSTQGNRQLPHVMAHNSVVINPFVRAVYRDAPFGDVGILS